MEDEIKTFEVAIDRLREQSKLMGEENKSALVPEVRTKYEAYEEEMEVDTEEEYEEIVEREVVKDVVQEVKVAQVGALYAYTGQGITMKKGEVGISTKVMFICVMFKGKLRGRFVQCERKRNMHSQKVNLIEERQGRLLLILCVRYLSLKLNNWPFWPQRTT